MSDGATIEEAITNGRDALRGWTLAMRRVTIDACADPLRGGLSN